MKLNKEQLKYIEIMFLMNSHSDIFDKLSHEEKVQTKMLFDTYINFNKEKKEELLTVYYNNTGELEFLRKKNLIEKYNYEDLFVKDKLAFYFEED